MIIRPKNWHDFQHYKERSPAWIKLHRRLLDDFDFQRLHDASRALAPMLWLLASESKDATVNADPEKLAFRLRRTPQWVVDALTPLIESGFFEVVQDASNPLAERTQGACSEREKEAEKEKDARARDDVPRGTLITPDGLNLEAWADWISYRRKIRKPLKDVSIRSAQRELAAHGADQAAVVEQSIAQGWTGLFALKAKPKNGAADAAKRAESERIEWQNLEERAERIGFRKRVAADDLIGYRTLVERHEANRPRSGAQPIAKLLGGVQ